MLSVYNGTWIQVAEAQYDGQLRDDNTQDAIGRNTERCRTLGSCWRMVRLNERLSEFQGTYFRLPRRRRLKGIKPLRHITHASALEAADVPVRKRKTF